MTSDVRASTRAALVEAAAHLFARRGIEAVPLRDVGELAGQRNASAVQYHFGGRWQLVDAVLARHGDTVAGWVDPGPGAPVGDVVAGVVELLRPQLAGPAGRDFLRIVFDLLSRYPDRWAAHPELAPGMQALVARLVEAIDVVPADVAWARAVSVTQFVSYEMSERARLLDDGVAQLDEATFVANLVAMATAMLGAPLAAPPGPPAPPAPAPGDGRVEA